MESVNYVAANKAAALEGEQTARAVCSPSNAAALFAAT